MRRLWELALVSLVGTALYFLGDLVYPGMWGFLWNLTWPAGPWLIAVSVVYFLTEAAFARFKFYSRVTRR